MKGKVRLLIADDHELVRQGLRGVLAARRDWEICAEAVTGREAVAKAEQCRPDVAILDFSMPELNGLEAGRQIRRARPQTEVLILTMHESEGLIREVLAAGVRGFVLKTDASKVLIQAIETLLRHRPFFTATVSEVVLDGYLNPEKAEAGQEAAASRLSPREREVVQLIAEGKSTKELADALGISPKTAETHRTNLMRKLNLRSVSEVVRYAIRNKLVEP